jgi:hypothetical protein
MSERVGDTARFQLRRKAGVKRRERSRTARAALRASEAGTVTVEPAVTPPVEKVAKTDA